MSRWSDRAGKGLDILGSHIRQRLSPGGRLYTCLGAVRQRLPRATEGLPHPFNVFIAQFGLEHPNARFIQIGANDGVQRDPLREQILSRSWSGLMVEPVPYVFERLRFNYGGLDRVTLVNSAVADSDGTRTIYYLPESDEENLWEWYHALASFRKEVLTSHSHLIPDVESRVEAIQVPCVSFESLCNSRGITDIDVLQIDTEGFDWEIIKGVDLERYRPAVLMFEQVHLSPEDRNDCYQHLHSHGYAVCEDVMDALAVSIADERLSRRLRRLWRRAGSDGRVAVR